MTPLYIKDPSMRSLLNGKKRRKKNVCLTFSPSGGASSRLNLLHGLNAFEPWPDDTDSSILSDSVDGFWSTLYRRTRKEHSSM